MLSDGTECRWTGDYSIAQQSDQNGRYDVAVGCFIRDELILGPPSPG